MRGTWPSTLACASPTSNNNPLGKGFGPAGADCGFREPLAPRLARPGLWMVATRKRSSDAEGGERRDVRSVLGCHCGIGSRNRFVGLERMQRDETRASTAELGDALPEGAVGPLAARPTAERREDLVVAALEEGHLESDVVALEGGVAVLFCVGRVASPGALEERRDAAYVSCPHGDVDVVVRASCSDRHRSRRPSHRTASTPCPRA
jgi:hypothetical protein